MIFWRAPACRLVALLVLTLIPLTTAAQDLELQPLLLIMAEADGATDGAASSLQMFRIPVSFTVRSLEERRWGFRLHLPVSFGAHDLQASTSVGDFTERIETMTVVPGAELLLRLDEWTLKPFIEVGVTASTAGGDPEAAYSVGMRVRGDHNTGRALLTTGLAARYSGHRSHRVRIDDYTTIELGADIQWPLRYRLGSRQVRAGGYAIVRLFPDLDLPSSFNQDLGRVYEVGLSFSTEPDIRLYKLKLPWIGVGYRFGDLFDGIRISFSFPF